MRRGAAAALGEIHDVLAVDSLIAALADADRDVRASVAGALGQIGDERAVNPLVAKLDDNDPAVREAAGSALCRIGPPSVEPLISVLKRGDPQAAEILGEIGDPRAIADLGISLGDNRVAAAAAEALGKFDDPHAIESLTRSGLESLDEDTRKAAIAALRKLGWTPDGGRAAAAWWIAQDEWAKCTGVGAAAVEPLVELLTDRGTDWRSWQRQSPRQYAGARALGGITDPLAVEPLIAALLGRQERAHHLLIPSIACALGGIADPRAVEPLIRSLSSGEAVIAALVRIGEPAVPPLLSELWTYLNHYGGVRDQGYRYLSIVDALGRIGDPRAVEPLIRARGQMDRSDLSAGVTAALVRIGEPAVEPLIAALENGSYAQDAAKTLGEIGDPRAVGPLTAALDSPYEEVPQAAAAALEHMGASPGRNSAQKKRP